MKSGLGFSGYFAFRKAEDAGGLTPGKYTLIDLSNVIDLFNITVEDLEWTEARFYDFNGNSAIDISDISYIAFKI